MQQLADGEETSWQFIDEFVDKTKYQAKFIQILSTKGIQCGNIFRGKIL